MTLMVSTDRMQGAMHEMMADLWAAEQREKRRLHEVVGSRSAEERDAELRAQAINVDATDVDAQAASAFASSAGASSSGVARSPRTRRQRQQDSEEDGAVNPGKRARVKMEPARNEDL